MGLIGITLGDPTGVGPEILVRALTRTDDELGRENFLIIGSELPVLRAARKLRTTLDCRKVRLPLPEKLPRVALVEPTVPRAPFEQVALRAVPYGSGVASGRARSKVAGPLDYPKHLSPGKPDASSGRLSLAYLELAGALAIEGRLSALVTLPLSKSAVAQEFPGFTGHTEYLRERTAALLVRMMLAAGNLHVTLATTHLPVSEVASHLTVAGISDTIKITHDFLESQLGRPPSIVVCALNPHAGDSGLLGSEENEIIAPACLDAQNRGCNCSGPHPADAALAKAAGGEYDAAVAMYHDQALIALKLLYPNRGANITLGLPFVRTSPLHGTGFDIAGKGIASEDSLMDALSWAVRLARSGKGGKGGKKHPGNKKPQVNTG